MANFAEELELEMRADLEEEMAAHRQSYQFGRSVQRIQDRTNRMLGFMLCAFSGFCVGLIVAALLSFKSQ